MTVALQPSDEGRRGWSLCCGCRRPSSGSLIDRGRIGRPPVPRQQFVEPRRRMFGDAGEHVGEPSLRIDIVHFCRGNETIHGSGAHAVAIRPSEQPRLSSERDTAQRALGDVVGRADAPVAEEARKRWPALQHVVHRLRADRQLLLAVRGVVPDDGADRGRGMRLQLL
jgi:hypothetical protein